MKSLFTLVGMKYRNAEDFVKSLPAGEPLTLVREPDNDFDPNAIQVWAHERHIAFVKGTEARKLARFMDNDCGGGPVMGKLAIDSGKWPMVEVEE